MNYSITEVPSLEQFIKNNETEIDGDYALFLYECNWHKIDSLNINEKRVFDEIVETYGQGIFSPHNS